LLAKLQITARGSEPDFTAKQENGGFNPSAAEAFPLHCRKVGLAQRFLKNIAIGKTKVNINLNFNRFTNC
jgi:hypothetical protein